MQRANEFLKTKAEEFKFRKKPLTGLLIYIQPTGEVDPACYTSLRFLTNELGNGFLKSRVGIEFYFIHREIKPHKKENWTMTEYGIVIKPLLQRTKREFVTALTQALELVDTVEAEEFMKARTQHKWELTRLNDLKGALEAKTSMLSH